MTRRGGGAPSRAPAWPTLLGAQLVAVSLLLGLGFYVVNLPPAGHVPDPAALTSEDLDHALQVLEQDRDRLRRELRGALFDGDEGPVTDFIALQVQAAELQFQDLEWTVLPPQGPVVPVELTLRVSGSYYNLPILVDGLFRQSRPLELTWLEVESPKLMVAHTVATLRAHFHRPPTLRTAALSQRVAEQTWGGDPALAEQALEVAAEVRLLEAFQQELRLLERARTSNRAAVMTALPGLLRRLPTSPLGWVGMRVDGDAVVVLDEPER